MSSAMCCKRLTALTTLYNPFEVCDELRSCDRWPSRALTKNSRRQRLPSVDS